MIVTKVVAEEFRANREIMQKIYKEKGLAKVIEMSTMTGVPILATLAFVSELDLSPTELETVEAYIKDLEKFYVTELIR